MYRYEIILQDSEDWIDCFTVFGYDEDAAIKEAKEQAIWVYGMEPDKLLVLRYMPSSLILTNYVRIVSTTIVTWKTWL